ncbi:MAG: hypothetical protein HT579_11015 [Candidatus Accumulibacter similis]|nr:MAG: hypothetical protein HT579_11015 [Candidatus Accumulibacter similis]
MTNDSLLLIAIFLLGVVVLVGILVTKKPGFGKFTTSTLLLAMVFISAALFFAAGKIDSPLFGQIAFAVLGFAGGLLANKETAPNPALQRDAPPATPAPRP